MRDMERRKDSASPKIVALPAGQFDVFVDGDWT